MATPLAYTATYAHAAEALRAALFDEQYWKDRVDEVGGVLVAFDAAADRVHVRMAQTIAAELPGIVTAVRPEGLVVTRTESYTREGGTFDARVEGVPARVSGTVRLTESDAAAVAVVDGSAEVGIPLFGRKIEGAVVARLLDMLAVEARFTDTWISGHRRVDR
ncbi:DUF2505 domain-containing protein [Nocardia beijingensis]|uniref:DUF2505 domain-containing protein n=1 Tax=Nocardia beijingensis TaxID=95162 RepID=UPI0018962F01|nr:DUF2505 domain-containing protein [Nocardia beijingensis]MBF6076382.1 DUF2505 domain-containing protein [Nocardia beijingensis]